MTGKPTVANPLLPRIRSDPLPLHPGSRGGFWDVAEHGVAPRPGTQIVTLLDRVVARS
jgi:hypothetical protein